MTSLVFPDINVWLALASSLHVHHQQAKSWYDSLDGEQLLFCRFTQLGLLCLLTTEAVMGAETLTQRQAWRVYDALLKANDVEFCHEPRTLEDSFRALSPRLSASPKDWADSYLAAFARETAAKLITFDKALAARSKEATVP